jgi:pantetheine-phosphate adenylyltransferase
MRITGGTARGRRLAAPRGRDVRPTSDKVREAIFDRLGPAGPGRVVLDLFAGTGALGLEALSRGAERVVLVDRDPRALAACRANVDALGLAATVDVLRAEAFVFLRGPGRGLQADLVLLDPPYAFDRWTELLAALRSCQAVRSGGMVVVERSARTAPAAAPGFQALRSSRYGDTAVDLLVAADEVPGAADRTTVGEAGVQGVAIYAGSFDPITNGHVGLIKRGLEIFDRLIVAVARNLSKETLFSTAEREEMIREAITGGTRVEVVSFDGLLVEYARARNVRVLLRGLRAVADFEYELQMANMNRKLWPAIETFFMMTEEDYFFVSSRNVKEIASFGGKVDPLVPPGVARRLAARFQAGPPDRR